MKAGRKTLLEFIKIKHRENSRLILNFSKANDIFKSVLRGSLRQEISNRDNSTSVQVYEEKLKTFNTTGEVTAFYLIGLLQGIMKTAALNDGLRSAVIILVEEDLEEMLEQGI